MTREVDCLILQEHSRRQLYETIHRWFAEGWNLQGIIEGIVWFTRDVPEPIPTVPYGKWLTKEKEKKDATDLSL